jgi:hypothetical protein
MSEMPADDSQPAAPDSQPPEDPDDRAGDGQMHDSLVPDTAECLAQLWSQPPDDMLAGVIALTTALRIGEQRAAAQIIDELMQDPDDYSAHCMLIKACLVPSAWR